MHKAWMVTVSLALLSGCGGDGPPPAAKNDARDVAMVERMNKPPFRPIRPEPFTDDDMAQYDLARSGCMFRPGDKADEAPLFITREDRGYVKIGGKLLTLAARGDSAELPSGAHAAYIGTQNWVELVAQAGDSGRGPDGQKAWPSRLLIRDGSERVAFDALGQVSCVADPARATASPSDEA